MGLRAQDPLPDRQLSLYFRTMTSSLATSTELPLPCESISHRHPSDMRVDARRNRQRIVAIARELFETRGSNVSMSTVARRAGVSISTLYRRFPDRQSLVLEVVTREVGLLLQCVDIALTDPDAGGSLFRVLDRFCETRLRLRILFPELLADPYLAPTIRDMQKRADQALSFAIARAVAAGVLHRDKSGDDVGDLTVVVLASTNIHAGSLEADLAAARRLVFLLHRSISSSVQGVERFRNQHVRAQA